MSRLYIVDREVSIGRLRPSNIILGEVKELSSVHLRIVREQNGATLYMKGKNGGYVNGRFIATSEKCMLSYADEISIPGTKLIWLNNLIALHSDYGTSYEVRDLLTYTQDSITSETDTDQKTYETDEHLNNQFFSKAPRTFYSSNEEIIELDPPPEKHIEEKQPLFMTIGPAFTMALPMVIGVSVSKMATRSAGISQAFMYTGLITAVSSAVFGLIWAISNIKNRQKQSIKNEEKRRKVYREYVRESELKIKEQYNKKASNLRLMYPDVTEYVPDGINRFLLWNRSVTDEDFLKIRIGTGTIPCNMNVQIPKERFSMIEDELKNLPGMLKGKYSKLKDVPETVDLLQNRYVGIVSDKKRIREETFLSLITMVSVTLSPEDVSIKCYLSNDTVGQDTINAVRFMPHLADNSPLESDDRICIVFTDNYEKIKDQLNEKTFLFIISNHFEKLPSVCKFIIQRESQFCGYIKLDSNSSIRRDIHFDVVRVEEAERISRLLQSVKLKSKIEEFILPEKYSFMELIGQEIDTEYICDKWIINDIREEIVCPLGIAEDGSLMILNIHEKSMGPHGLIAGMTGSGKSEVLQTIILSLSANYSPEDVGFFLIDYKGGGMSKLFEHLPHVLGSISNLSGKMAGRAMVSVRAENERRQKLFINAGVNNINQYKSRSSVIKDMEPLPHIFIIIDEFAELKKEEPDFMKDIISVARVGRSLGVHLILATQKPAGVVDDNVFSNSRFRICLRLQDRVDSMEMLKHPDAAYITNTGRAILQVGNDEIYKCFQGAYTMDKSYIRHKKKELKLYEEDGHEVERIKSYAYEATVGEAQLNRVLISIIAAEEKMDVRKIGPLWLNPLQDSIDRNVYILDRFSIAVGVYDNPKRQMQGELKLNLFDTGNVLIIGGLLSGKSTLIANILLSFLYQINTDFYNIFIIDFSSGLLNPFKENVMCGGYISEENEEDIGKLFALIEEIIDERKKLINGENYSVKIKTFTSKDKEYIQPIIIVIDGLNSLRERTQGRYDRALENLLRVSESLGIFVYASANNMSSSEVTKRMFDGFRTCIPLRLKDKYEYKDALRIQGFEILIPDSIAGRGVTTIGTDVCEFQTYMVSSLTEEIVRSNQVFKRADIESNLKKMKSIPIIPKSLDIHSFIKELEKRNSDESGIPVGFFAESGKIFYLPYEAGFTVLISGRKGSGKTNLLNVIKHMSEYKSFATKVNDTEDIENQDINNNQEIIEYQNGMTVYVYDESLSFEEQIRIKEEAGEDPYFIHLGGALNRQNIADFSYIPYSKQVEIMKSGEGLVRKTLRENSYGEVVIPVMK